MVPTGTWTPHPVVPRIFLAVPAEGPGSPVPDARRRTEPAPQRVPLNLTLVPNRVAGEGATSSVFAGAAAPFDLTPAAMLGGGARRAPVLLARPERRAAVNIDCTCPCGYCTGRVAGGHDQCPYRCGRR